MSAPALECFRFESQELLPENWRHAADAGPVRLFNPAILRDGDGWRMAYRAVLPDGKRRIAACRLDAALRVIAGSPFALSDHVQFPAAARYPDIVRSWLADPRLYRWGERVFVYWNSGWHEPRNYQFLQELDPAKFAPVGAPRELVLRAPRRPLEKNWTLLAAADGNLRAIYSVSPHRVLGFSIAGDGDIAFDEVIQCDFPLTTYPPCHGGLRGGAPPVWHDGRFWSFCHSVHDGPDGYCYKAGVYCFSDAPRFAPLAEPLKPLDLGSGSNRTHPRLNPAVDEVVYPCGAAIDGDRWLVSHGINDERCAISIIPHADLLAHVEWL